MFFVTPGQLEKLKTKVGNLDIQLSNSFGNVREDVNNIYEWINYLHSEVSRQNSVISDLQITIKDIPKNKAEIRAIVDDYYQAQPLARKINELIVRVEKLESTGVGVDSIKANIERLIQANPAVIEALDELRERVNSLENRSFQASPAVKQILPQTRKTYTRPKLQEKVLRSVARSSKEYIKSTILSLVQKYKDISALKLREIIVEEQGIASKSSFYRMVEELESEGKIEMMRVGKEKHCFALEKPRKH